VIDIDSKKKALIIAKAASDKKALDIVTIDMRSVPSIADYFVIASATSSTHVNAVSDHIARTLRADGEKLWHIEGEREALWVLLDFGDVVAHVFFEETRRFYDLEKLWGDVPQKRFKETIKKRKTVKNAKKKKKTAKRAKKG
jgi:ribosome-associated protein